MRELLIIGLRELQNSLEVFPLTYGIVGLVGVWISDRRSLDLIAPPHILLPWFAVIAIISGIDLSYDFHSALPRLDQLIGELEELVELLVGISGFLFVWLNARKLSTHGNDKTE